MKAALNSHVEQQRHVMFQRSADEVRNLLQRMVKDVQKTMDEKADEVFVAVRRDYRSVLGGNDLPQGELLPKAQRLMRKEIMSKIDRVENTFKRVAGLKVEDDEEDEGNSDAAEDVDPPGPGPTDRDGHVSAQTSPKPDSASTTAVKSEQEAEHTATKDVPMTNASSAIAKIKAEASEPTTSD